MIKIYSPENDMDLAIIRSIFDGENINYFVQNDHFGSLRMGPRIDLYNTKNILVSENDYEKAKALIFEYVENKYKNVSDEQIYYSKFDKIRMILETILFGWFIPGKVKNE